MGALSLPSINTTSEKVLPDKCGTTSGSASSAIRVVLVTGLAPGGSATEPSNRYRTPHMTTLPSSTLSASGRVIAFDTCYGGKGYSLALLSAPAVVGSVGTTAVVSPPV